MLLEEPPFLSMASFRERITGFKTKGESDDGRGGEAERREHGNKLFMLSSGLLWFEGR